RSRRSTSSPRCRSSAATSSTLRSSRRRTRRTTTSPTAPSEPGPRNERGAATEPPRALPGSSRCFHLAPGRALVPGTSFSGGQMPRPITLFPGQWADMPLAELAPLAREMGYDGLELACWGDHLDVRRAADDPSYAAERKALLERHGLQLFAISNHLVGQAV